MKLLKAEIVEQEVANVVKEICSVLKIEAVIDSECFPGTIIKSQVLLSVIGSIADALGVIIPNDCYIFREKNLKELTIKETAQKIIQVAIYEN